MFHATNFILRCHHSKKQTIVNVMGQRFTSSIMCNLKKFNINVLSHNQIKANTSIALKSSIELSKCENVSYSFHCKTIP